MCSLLTLSRVIMGLGKASSRKSGSSKTPFVNYRDSKLTRILQSSLSGNARMAVICCATLSDAYTEETKSTLQFASRAKLVKTRASANEIDEDPSVIKKLQREVAQRSEEGKQALRQLRELERQAKDAEKARDDVDKRLKKLYDFVRTSDMIHLLSQDREYGQVLSTRNCSYEPALPALAKATPAKPFAKAPLHNRRSTMKNQFSESLFVRTSLDGSEGSGAMMEGGVTASAVKSSFISPRYNDTVSTFDQPSTHVTLLKDALAAKTTQVRKLMEESSKVDVAALDELRKEMEVLQKKAEYAAKEKEDALDWVEELHDKLEKAEREALEASDGKEVAFAENERLLDEIEKLKEIQAQSAGDSEKIVADLRSMYEDQNSALQRELKEAKEKSAKNEKLLNSAKQDRDLMRERMERVSAERDEARTSMRELQQENTTLMESLDDLQVENDQALQIIEELTSEKQDLVAENESQQAQLKVFSQMEADHEELLKQVSAVQEERDDLLEQLNTVHTLVANKSPRNSESDGIQTLQIIEQLTDAMESNEALDSACRRMTSENQELREQLEHLNSSIQCQSDIAKSTEEELTAENLDLRDELAEVGKSAARARASMLAIEGEKHKLSNMLEASEAKAKELRVSVNTLEAEKDEISSKLEGSQAQAKELQATVATLSAALEDAQSDAKRTQEERDFLAKDLSEASDSLQQALVDIDDLKAELTESATALSNMRDASGAKTNELRASVDILEGEKKDIAGKLEASQAQAQELQVTIATLSSALEGAQSEIKQAQEERDSLNRNLSDATNRLQQALTNIEKLEAELTKRTEERDESSAIAKRLEAEVSSLTRKVGALEASLEQQRSDLLSSEKELLDKVDVKMKNLEQEKEGAIAQMEELSSELANTLGRLAVEAEKVETLSHEKTALGQSNEALASKLSTLEVEAQAKDAQITEISTKLDAANAFKEEFAQESKRILSLNSDLSIRLNTAEEDAKNYADRLEAVTKDLAATQDELERFVSRARDEVKTKEEEISKLSSELSMANKNLDAIRAEMDNNGKTESKMKAIAIVERTKMEQEIKNLRKQASSSEEARMELETQYEEKCAAESALRRDVTKLERDLAAAMKEVDGVSAVLRQTRADLENQEAAISQDKSLSRRLDAVSEENTILHSQVDALQNTVEELTSELCNVTKQLEVTQTNAKVEAGSSDKVNKLQSQVKDQARFLASKDSELKMLQSKMQKLSFERDDAVAKMMRIRRESSTALTQVATLERQLQEKDDAIGSQSADMAKSMESLAESRSTLQREISRLEHQKAEAERLAKRVRRESSSTSLKNRELQNALNHANDCKEELEDRIRQYEQLIEESDKDHGRMISERKVLLRDHSREIGALKRDKMAAERECAVLMGRLEEMASQIDMLEAAKQSSEAKAQRLLEQKHRALNRLDNTKEETFRTIRAVETQSKAEQERERRIAEMRFRAIQAEKENELKARDTKLSLYEAERNNLGKTTKRSLSLVGREAKRGLAAAREKGSHVLRSRSKM